MSPQSILPAEVLGPCPNCNSRRAARRRREGAGQPPATNRASSGAKRAVSGGESRTGPRQSGRGMVGGAGVRAGPGGLCVCARGGCCRRPLRSLRSRAAPAGDGGAGLSCPAAFFLCDGTGREGERAAAGGRDVREAGAMAGPAKASPAFPDRVQELTPAGRWRVVRLPSKGAGAECWGLVAAGMSAPPLAWGALSGTREVRSCDGASHGPPRRGHRAERETDKGGLRCLC